MPNSHSCSRGKVWRRAHRQSGKRIPGACVKKSKSIKSVRKMKSKSRKMKSMRKMKSRSKKSKSRSKKSKSKSRKMRSKSRKSKSRKMRSKSRKYHGIFDDFKNAAKKAANALTGAASKAAGALVPSGIPYLSSAAKKAVKGAGEAAHFDGYYAGPKLSFNRAAGKRGPRQ